MDIECGFCQNKFTLDAIHIRREQVNENPIVKGVFDAIFGVQPTRVDFKYFLYCPKCHRKIARFDFVKPN